MRHKIVLIVFLLVICLQFVTLKTSASITAPNNFDAPDVNYEAECPIDYYDALYGLKGDNLLENLAVITEENHIYYNSYDELRGGNCYSDADPNDPENKLIDFYTGWSIDNSWVTSGTNYAKNHWNREHLWCQSLSGGLYGESGAGSDIHHLRPELIGLNSARNNAMYADVQSMSNGTQYYFYNPNTGIEEFTGCYNVGNTYFEPRDEVKGDVARILMYMYMHYSSEVDSNISRVGISSSRTQASAGDLSIKNIVYTPYNTDQEAWNLLLEWNDLDSVDEFEMNRNNYCASVTGTRNPFIDHPEFADMIWDINYEGEGALVPEVEEPISVQLNNLLTKYYNDSIYMKKTEIYLTGDAENELVKYFHGKVDLNRTTYFNGENLLMGDIDGKFDFINSGYKTSDDKTKMDHFNYDFEKEEMVVDYSVDDTTLYEFYPIFLELFEEDYFNDWDSFEYNVTSSDDKYLNDFLAYTAPCLTTAILDSNYITANGITLSISEVKGGFYGDYVSLKMIVGDTDSSKVGEDRILSEARLYQGNKAFDDTIDYVKPYSFIFSDVKEIEDSSLSDQLTNSDVARNLVIGGMNFKYTPIWKNVGEDNSTLTGYHGINNLKGVQIGSSSNPAECITLETQVEEYITKIAINASTASGSTATLSIYIDNEEIASNVILTNEQTIYSYELENPLNGNLKFVISQPETNSGIYIQAIAINTDIQYERFDVIVDQGVENGSLSVSSNNVIKHDTVELTITPDEGYTLEKLLINGQTQSVTGNTYTLTITTKTVITATFIPIKNDNFTWTSKWSSLEDGTYNVLLSYVADDTRYIAPTTFISNKFKVVSYNSVVDYTNYTFIVIKSGSTINIKVGTQYLAYNSGTNFKWQTTAYNFTITTHSSEIEYLMCGTRYVAGNYSANYIGPYATSNISNGYKFIEFAVIE